MQQPNQQQVLENIATQFIQFYYPLFVTPDKSKLGDLLVSFKQNGINVFF